MHNAMKYLSVQYQVTELKNKYTGRYHVLKGCYAFGIGNKILKDSITFQFSILGHVMTSSETVHIEQQYWPEKRFDPVNEWEKGYLWEVFCVKDESDVMIDLRVSLPEDKTLYLHLQGIKLKNPYE